MSQRCDVLLATYNNAPYLGALLDSLLAQSDGDFTLLIRDDGSTDATWDILVDYLPRFDGRARLLNDRRPSGSAKANFALLLAETTADHILFCDADDVWKPGKVALLRGLLAEAEAAHGSAAPIYAFTDVTPVNAMLAPIQQSYWEFKKVDPIVARQLNRLVLCPPMLGCASGINLALARLALPMPTAVTGIDWWALLLACIFGHAVWSSEQTMLYRIHGNNDSQPRKVGLLDYAFQTDKLARVRRGVQRRIEQADAILEAHRGTLPPDARQTLEQFVSIRDKNFVGRRLGLLRGRHRYPDLPRTLATYICV